MDSFPPDAPAPRLCHVVKRADFEGFGFNLYAGKVKQGQFIGKVDANSPAEAAGLKPGDRIIEVNSVNIGNENHKQVSNVATSKRQEGKTKKKSKRSSGKYFP
jgi:S1-C subfamily serine protease